MICPECGANIDSSKEICPLCEKRIDRESAYKNFIAKGDNFFNTGNFDKAILSYSKALDYFNDREELYIKLGNAYSKKMDKKAAHMYLKALILNFYNDTTHNLIISFYSYFNKLEDLKKWYEKNKANYDSQFIDKYIKIIDNILRFKNETSVKIGQKENFLNLFFISMKEYILMNIVMGLVILVIIAGGIAAFLFKVNIIYIIIFLGVFFLVSLFFISFTKMKSIKKKKGTQENLENLLNEFKN